MTTNIFYRFPSLDGTRLLTIPESHCTLKQFWNILKEKLSIDDVNFILAYGPRVIRPNSCSLENIILQNNSHVDILIPLVGGKGGFGSLLRAIGAQIEKTTNRDACRDLQGRRLRDVKKEEELRKLIALQEKLIEEKNRRKQEKLEKLRKSAKQSEASLSIQELINMFEDQEYNNRRLKLGDIIEAALDKGIINSKKRSLESDIENGTPDEDAKKIKTNHDRAPSNIDNPPESDSQIDPDSIDRHIIQNTDQQDDKLSNNNKKPIDQSIVKANHLWLGLESDEED